MEQRTYYFLQSKALVDIINHPAVDDVSLGANAKYSEVTIIFKSEHKICEHLAPFELGGRRVTITVYANGFRFDWKDAKLDLQHLEYIGMNPGVIVRRSAMINSLVDYAITAIYPTLKEEPVFTDLFLTSEDISKLQREPDVIGFGLSPLDNRVALTVLLRPGCDLIAAFSGERPSFEVLFDAKSICFHWLPANGVECWDSFETSEIRNIAKLFEMMENPVSHMRRLLLNCEEAQAIAEMNQQRERTKRHEEFRSQFGEQQ